MLQQRACVGDKAKIGVSRKFEKRLGALEAEGENLLAGGKKGIEKEALRVDLDGFLAQTRHPQGLGSALTNRFVTTDFSEALLEFVTPAFESTWEALRFLCDIHQFAYRQLDDEMLWVASMPCRLPADEDIPLARYGSSNVGQMKTIYRRGLGLRYGRYMQTIAGVHYNYSLPDVFWPRYQNILGSTDTGDDFRSAQYFALVRNFRRFGWIVLYLFGASPAICKCFENHPDLDMPSLDDGTWYEPWGTSLRMSDLGYSNRTQAQINISLDNIDSYVRDLAAATHSPEPAYEEFGVKVGGEYRQLNANRLQIENEYYSSVRPKRVARSGERPTAALQRGGVEYVEIRSLDVNISDPTGVNQNTMRFIEAFLVYCLLEDSPPLDEAGFEESRHNQTGVATRGRDPDFRLVRDGREIPLRAWASEMIEMVTGIAALIDRGEGGNSYLEAARHMKELVDEPDATPSARLLAELREQGMSFFDYAYATSHKHRDYFDAITPMPDERYSEFEAEVLRSIESQNEIEASDRISFDQYLANYFDQ
jgi:glutamate--cysteine ligase